MVKGALIKKLEKVLGEEGITTRPEDLFCYSFDATQEEYMPQVVAFPQNPQQVQEIMRLAWEEEIPVIPRGAGSGFTGGSLPVRGGMVVSTERLDRILEIDERNLTALVEPGVVTARLQEAVEALGLFYPPDPASMDFSTIGGNVAENAGGPRAVKYGVTRDYVLGIEAVLPGGGMITTGRKVMKDVVGYDLTRLLVGSEGTLAFFTRILLRLLPLPPATGTLLALFSSREQAGEAVAAVIQSRILPTAMEFIDRGALEAVRKYAGIEVDAQAQAVLLVEVDGEEDLVSRLRERVAKVCEQAGGTTRVARDQVEAQELWQARRAISPSLVHVAPTKINEDIVVPRSRLPQALARMEALEEKYDLPIVCFGHAGDGNIHVNVMTDRGDPERWRRAQEAVREVFAITVELGGTLSGEHGVGVTKAPYLSMELSPQVMELFRGIKRVFDPKNLLNPGKMGLE
jgi:glycolate oxidase